MYPIAIITPKESIYTNPLLIALFEKLNEEKIDVFLIAPRQKAKNISGYKNIFHLKYFPFYFSRFPRRPFIIMQVLFSYMYTAFILRKNKVKILVGIDPEGLVIGGRLNRILKGFLGYLSFEIIYKDELLGNAYFELMKKKEIEYSKKILFLAIQDDERKNLLLKENHIDATNIKIFNVPVSPVATNRIKNPDVGKKLGIPYDKKLVLYSGSIGDWTGASDILESLENFWDENFWLVIHSHSEFTEGSALKERIDSLMLNGCPVSLHNEPFEAYSEYSSFVGNFDIGLVYYKPDSKQNIYKGKNTEFIGLSSGKFSTYMMLGIPVIFNGISYYKKLLEKYDFGAKTKNNEDMSACLADIRLNYKKKSKWANILYKELLDPDKTIPPLIRHFEKIDSLINLPGKK